MGTLSPYQVYANDGQLISAPYDGCTRMTLLTERDRFSYYYHTLIFRGRIPKGQKSVTPEMLRNAGQPFWRSVRFPISDAEEQSTRLRFWEAVGYDRAKKGWWIAWIPEQGHFEINLPLKDGGDRLEKFWTVAPRKYKYAVVTADGTLIQTRQF